VDNLAPEVRAQEPARLIRVLIGLEQPHAVFRQTGSQFVVPARRLIVEHDPRAVPDRAELLRDGHPVDRQLVEPEPLFLEQGGDPDHEELVEVRPDDRQELHALEQGMVVPERLVEHPLVELQPAHLAIREQAGVLEIGHSGGRGDRMTRHGYDARSAAWRTSRASAMKITSSAIFVA
jgi:hypothetical protein